MRLLTIPFLLVLLSFAAPKISVAQSHHGAISRAIADTNLRLANSLLNDRLLELEKKQLADSMPAYIWYVGKIALMQTNAAKAISSVKEYVQNIIDLRPSPEVQQDAYTQAAAFYESINQNDQAYRVSQQALALSNKVKQDRLKTAAIIESNMGTYAFRMGDVNLAEQHHRNAIAVFLKLKTPDYNRLYLSGNNMGGMMWYASKNDSALHYFNIALDAVSRMDSTPENMFYRPAVLQNNLSALHGAAGKTGAAINAMKVTIRNLQQYLASNPPPAKRDKAIHFQYEATDNLAGIYKGLGDYRQAHELLYYSYQEKKKQFIDEDPDIFKSQILLGQLYFAMKDYAKTRLYLRMALERIVKADGNFLFWQADAYNTLALLHDVEGDEIKAKEYYEKADEYYEQSLEGEYDDIYLEFLTNAALFYAENKMYKTALAKAKKGYAYVNKTSGPQSLAAFYQVMNLAQVKYLAGDFKGALTDGDSALRLVNTIVKTSKSVTDSVKIELKKPKAILLVSKIRYQLLPSKNELQLKALLNELHAALAILEQRKTLLPDPGDLALLIADHAELIAFVKKITLDLFNITGHQQYARELINLHESAIYTRIRARLDKSTEVRFIDVPADVQENERRLKDEVANALKGNQSHEAKMKAYLAAMEKLESYMAFLRKNHSRYYQMRYGSIFRDAGDIQSRIANDVSVIRYFYVDSVLMAAVYEKQAFTLFNLGQLNLTTAVTAVAEPSTKISALSAHLNRLHHQLWQPLRPAIRHKKLVIIPDGILFNLNFELLTDKPLKTYQDLAAGSLLAHHIISYQYSLLLTGQVPGAAKKGHNFVAFAPGFSDQVKSAYKSAVMDSNEIDRAYLSLLPQPFTTSLAVKAQQLLGGNTYLYDQSTLPVFKSRAGSNRIIHIGTHAEANNLHPEFSRLIFTKAAAGDQQDNSLFLFDIYNCDLSSNLTVLTACESGKPGYQDGEGMISLAHAFNYAGSESIITGLWKIDEQASANLMDLFYTNIAKGVTKDEALRQAKLNYLVNAKGRTAAPQYWAGLILLGNTEAIEISKRPSGLMLSLGLLAFVISTFVVIRLIRARNAKNPSYS